MFRRFMENTKRKVCSNCNNKYIEGDKYCRYCGAPMGKPSYIDDNFACIYGPPPEERIHVCENCGYSWQTHEMVDNQKWCPKCRGNAPATIKDESEWNI